jgi:hypothetical protein
VLLLGLVLACAWTIRAGGTLIGLRHQTYNVRSDWVGFDEWVRERRLAFGPDAMQLKEVLRRDAIARVPPSTPVGDWLQVFDID